MNSDLEWLKRMADLEDECESIGVGGLMVDMGWKNEPSASKEEDNGVSVPPGDKIGE